MKRLVEEFDPVHSEIDRQLFYLVTKERLDEYGKPITLTESEQMSSSSDEDCDDDEDLNMIGKLDYDEVAR